MSVPLTGVRSEVPVFIGESPAAAAVRAEIVAAARTPVKVLILGETGVGKEVVARLIHCESARARWPFLAVNCSGIPETLLESELFGHVRGSFTGAIRDKSGLIRQAERGTLFLDELGEMSLRMQAVLLRFTETGEIQPIGADKAVGRTDVRLITATNRDLRTQIAAGAFREDLYYRLNVIQIHVPPLRERTEDILPLLDYYLERMAQAHERPKPVLTADAAQMLLGYEWPGNVRELRNVTERLVLHDRSCPLTPNDLPREIRGVAAGASTVAVDSSATGNSAPSSHDRDTAERVQRLWDRMQNGEDFWTVVHQPFKARELTRADLLGLVDRGLKETRGSYRALLKVFHLGPDDYKRFHAFLYQQHCNLAVAPYRTWQGSSSRSGEADASRRLGRLSIAG